MSCSLSRIFLSSATSVREVGGDGSTEANGFVSVTEFFLSFNQFIRSKAISHVSATSTTGSFLNFSRSA